ncbi:MAG: hypothetical protein JJE47_05065 [Acidimicrobiia bacterium]|nr:hypothetical protein [Acidimicrobiia bacterium]
MLDLFIHLAERDWARGRTRTRTLATENATAIGLAPLMRVSTGRPTYLFLGAQDVR